MTALCGADLAQNGKMGRELITISWISVLTLTDMWLFQNGIPGSLVTFDLKSVLAKQTSDKITYKS